MRDSVSCKLGGISSDLARLANLLKSGSNDQKLFSDLVTELKCFTEWTAAELPVDQQEMLLQLQRTLLKWIHSSQGALIQKEATAWSDKILDASGLLG